MLKDAWALAIETLSWIELQRLGERLALARASKQLAIQDPKVVGLAHKLVFETQRRLNVIDSALAIALAPKSLGEYRLGVQSFLRLYACRVLFESADLEEAVAMASMARSILGWHQLNDVEEALGKLLSLPLTDVYKGAGDEETMALRTFNPTWFVKYCFKMLGRGQALNFLESAALSTPTFIRVNALKASEETCLQMLREEGVTLEKEPLLKHAYRVVETRKPLMRTQSFREGYFYIQDKASSFAAEVADPKPGDTVLDICAAPGAKTTYLAQLMQNEGTIYSIDYSRRRIQEWKRETKRMGVKNSVAIIADAQRQLPITLAADLVVLDPPCTSTGAFGKTPSAKWRLTKRSVFTMAEIQWNMLNNCAGQVKDGGHLLYSTCSVALEENEMLIERFLRWRPEFKLVTTTPRLGLPGFRGLSECQRLYPHIHDCNGFFVAKLVKEDA
ncbi:MAG TPA: NOL1/NOP2/sun family putative RNA methylase [Candidatus Bathyarchaeia archaeon]|nr:NOL1/NOP2/sun family putative RNA methylase [Candidatus Bathyarchaeia archaeon]